MPAPHVTTARTASRKRPVSAASTVARKAGTGIIAAGATQAVRREAIDPERRLQMIAEAAYYRSEKRGFTPGGELQDWLEAEAEVATRLRD